MGENFPEFRGGLQLSRALALLADTAEAGAAYQNFLGLYLSGSWQKQTAAALWHKNDPL